MKRFDVINYFIDKYGYEKYCEIGTQSNISFTRVNIKHKTSVDPDPKAKADFVMPSDQFFAQLSRGVTYEIFFIDGLHTKEQVYLDIMNALEHLSEGGTIVCHDCNPQKEIEQRVPRETKRWNGDVWQAIVRLRTKRDDLEFYTIDTDEGCTVIRRGKSKKLDLKGQELCYANLEKNRKEWLNLISVDEFLEKLDIKKKVDMSRKYRVHQFQPYAIDGNYGAEIKYYVDLVPNDNDWIIIADYDVMCLTPHHIHKIREYIDAYPDTGMFLPYVNRVKQYKQVYDMKLFENPDIKVHQKLAVELAKKPISVTELNIVISGYFMIFKKATYKKIVPPDGLLGCDNKISRRILNLGMPIRMMNTVYAFHYYRFNEGIHNKSHLKNIPK